MSGIDYESASFGDDNLLHLPTAGQVAQSAVSAGNSLAANSRLTTETTSGYTPAASFYWCLTR